MTLPAGQSGFELDRLKELLLRPETDRLESVESRVGALDARLGAADRLETATSEILVEAFRRTEVAQHRELANAVAPVVVAAIRNEIKNSKDMMVEALYPITGRLVAAAVANAFRDLVAGLNERLDRSLSTRYWRLRFKSLATGRPLSELALAEAQKPVLRRLLLLERGSGRLIASWHVEGEEQTQSELVSGLIAAITEFASSVYGARSGELRTLDLGDARVFLRGAPVYLIAAECAGALRPEHEREIDDAFLSLVGSIDRTPDKAQGAIDDMAAALFVTQPEKTRSSLPLIVIALSIAGIVAWFASGPLLRGLKERRIDAAFGEALAARPELAAYPLHLKIDHAARSVTVEGLDPSDTSAASLAQAIEGAAAPYKVEQRTAAVAQLNDLQTRAADFATLAASLKAQLAAIDAQIAALEQGQRGAIDKAFGQAIDKANDRTTSAARDLQSQTQAASDRLGSMIAGLAPGPRDSVAALLSRTAIFFAQADALADADLAARRADEIAAALKDHPFDVRVVGQTDASGGDRRNLLIAQARASAVVGMLVQRGVDPARLRVVVRTGALAPNAVADPRDRRVTFELAYDDEKRP